MGGKRALGGMELVPDAHEDVADLLLRPFSSAPSLQRCLEVLGGLEEVCYCRRDVESARALRGEKCVEHGQQRAASADTDRRLWAEDRHGRLACRHWASCVDLSVGVVVHFCCEMHDLRVGGGLLSEVDRWWRFVVEEPDRGVYEREGEGGHQFLRPVRGLRHGKS